MLIIKEIEWSNFYENSSGHLDFSLNNNVLIADYPSDCPLKGVLTAVIEVLCTDKYTRQQSCEQFIKHSEVKSFVRLKLVQKMPIHNAKFVSLNVWLHFDNNNNDNDEASVSPLANVTYELNGRKKRVTISLPRFQGLFQLNFDYILRQYGIGYADFKVNMKWQDMLKLFDLTNEVNGHDETTNQLINSVMSNKQEEEEEEVDEDTQNILCSYCKIPKIILATKKKLLFKTLNYLRKIFEYLTYNEYTVYFVMTYDNNTVKVITDVQLTDISFKDMTTYIQLYKHKDRIDFTNNKKVDGIADNFVHELFFIAFQLAFSSHTQQRFVFISNLKRLHEFVSTDAMTRAFLGDKHHAKDTPPKNYLQRVTDIATRLELITIIENPGLISLPIENANLISCRKTSSSWIFKVKTKHN